MGARAGHSSIRISNYIVNEYDGAFSPFFLAKYVVMSYGQVLAALGVPLIRDRIDV